MTPWRRKDLARQLTLKVLLEEGTLSIRSAYAALAGDLLSTLSERNIIIFDSRMDAFVIAEPVEESRQAIRAMFAVRNL